MINNTITSPKGFLASGISCGIKTSGKKDIALLCCPAGAVAAGVFTTNKIVSAAVEAAKAHLKSRIIEAVIVNSGNANTCTGKKGLEDASKMCQAVADFIDCRPEQVLVASTGIIGRKLPMDKILPGISAAAQELSNDPVGGFDFASAIMTTDTVEKQAVKRFKLGNKTVTISGTVKGAGMIAPNMATTICVLTTDANISKPMLKKALKESIGNSLNKLTVDGHQSTNDTAFLLSSCMAGNTPIKSAGRDYEKFSRGLFEICYDLAEQMALDAEGATRVFKVLITGAANQAQAQKAARAVADYDLVKCAIHGGDPNWGRIICAVGSCGVKINPEKLTCKLDNITVFRNGAPCKFDTKKASAVISKPFHTITVGLGVGKAEDFCLGCDLSKEYVTINADYHT
ncbi:Arginine biosynthesis bifunctional protein ArgJ [Limihaloglobus sulfuriphilus]|uniref:Arginine biosynthesis bifunctional protein ArgJ n=1 Tax=Limihaloglobus sulfuriphilus TaxID=1851148 RepID=A0A1Q2MAL5_9BACT|nr:bifunctional glutamate N-acetyltransferase/amino-acid acetyltransferase ArgJ [Limihaloglobus sulfuriphilus]AQQ69714.1 Arginine biosynthesis bifunctional protein ArgJ [Limihaloglobus sulfuriphilus]